MIPESCWGNEGLSPFEKKNVPAYQGLVLAELSWVLLPALMFDLTEGELANSVKTQYSSRPEVMQDATYWLL